MQKSSADGHNESAVRIFYYMDITCLKAGESARIISVEAKGELKERLFALSVCAGATVRLLKVSFFKRTYLIESGSVVALRREVASCVKIAKI